MYAAVAALIICLSFTNVFAQEEKEESYQDSTLSSLEFETTEYVPQKAPYFALGGGYLGSFMFNKFDDFNNMLKSQNFNVDKFKSPVYLSGVSFFTAIGVIKNMRVGFTGMGQTLTNEKDIIINNVKYKQGVEYSTYFTGFSVDYALPLFKSFAVVPSVIFGYNSLSIEAYQQKSSYSWSDYKPGADANNYLNRASGNFWYLQPTLNIEYAVTPFLMVRVAGSYNLNLSSSWTMNKSADLKNVPDGLSNKGFNLQLGAFIGLFNY